MKAVLAFLALALAGCAGGVGNTAKSVYGFYNDRYDRSLSISTTTDGKPQVSYTITPKAGLSDAQMAQIMAHLAAYAIKDGKAVIPPTK